MPITLDIQPNGAKQKTSTQIKSRQAASRYEKKQLATTISPKKVEAFDKTIHSQFLVFRKLFDKERELPSEKIELNNSMNRILAAEMINLQMKSSSKSRSKTVQP
jgi:hypothetical protein